MLRHGPAATHPERASRTECSDRHANAAIDRTKLCALSITTSVRTELRAMPELSVSSGPSRVLRPSVMSPGPELHVNGALPVSAPAKAELSSSMSHERCCRDQTVTVLHERCLKGRVACSVHQRYRQDRAARYARPPGPSCVLCTSRCPPGTSCVFRPPAT